MSRKASDTLQAVPLRQLDQMLEHIESLEYIAWEMALVGCPAHIGTHLAELKDDVILEMKTLLFYQYQLIKEAKASREEGRGPMKLKNLVDEVRSIADEGKMDATDSTFFVEIVAEAWNRLEGRRRSERTAGDLISEIGHDLDEIVTGWSQKDDALIEVGIKDARRDLEELRQAITEARAL